MALAMTETAYRKNGERDSHSSGAHSVSHQHTVIVTQIIGSQIFCLKTSKLSSSHQTERAAKTDNLEINKLPL